MAAAGKPKSSLFAPSGFSFTAPAPAATSQPAATSGAAKESEKKDLFASSGFKFDLAPRKNATADANVKPLKRRKYVAKTAAVPQQTTVVHLNENKMATWKKRHRELMGKAGAVGAGAGASAAAPAQLKPRARAAAGAPAEKADGKKKSEKKSEKKSSVKAKDAEAAAQASAPVVAPTVTPSTELPAPGAPLFPAATNKAKRERIRSMPLVRTIKKPAAKAPPKPKTAEELAADKKAAKKKNKRDRQKQRARETPEDAAKAKTTTSQSPAKAAAKPAASSPAGDKSAAASPVTKSKTPAKTPTTAQSESQPKKGKQAAAKQAAASPSKEKAAASTSAAALAPAGAGEFVEDAEQVAALTRADERARRLMPTVHHRIVGAAYVQYVREYLSYRGWDEGLPVVTSVAEGKSVALLALAQTMVPPRVATVVRQLSRTTLHWLAYSPSLAGALVERGAADPSQVALQRVMLAAGEEAIAPEEGKVGTLKLGRAGMASYALGHVVEANNLEVTCLALEAILTFITLGVMQSNGLSVPSQRTDKALPQLRRYFLAACGMVLVIGASAEEVGRFVRALPSSEGWLLSAALAGGILCCCDVPPSGSGKG